MIAFEYWFFPKKNEKKWKIRKKGGYHNGFFENIKQMPRRVPQSYWVFPMPENLNLGREQGIVREYFR